MIAARRGKGLEVEAGAEMAAGAGEDRDLRRLVALERVERFAQSGRGLGIDCVAALGAVDGDDGDRALGLDAHAHIARSFPAQKGSRSARRNGLPTALSGIESTKRTALGAL